MSVGGEVVRTIPLQRTFMARKSHDKYGNRLIPLLGADASYNSGVIQVSGNTDMEIFNQADKDGTVYIFMGPDPIELAAKIIGEELVMALYDPVPGSKPAAVWVQRCAGEYMRVLYVNSDEAQGAWEFSIQLRPIGRG